jgi:hypothetical protein
MRRDAGLQEMLGDEEFALVSGGPFGFVLMATPHPL